MQLTDAERRLLLAIQAHPGADARTVKRAAGITPDQPGYMGTIGILWNKGLLRSHGPLGWKLSPKGAAVVRELLPLTRQ